MVNDLNSVLRELFQNQVRGLRLDPEHDPPESVTEAQIGFQPPDQDWRSHVNTNLGTRLALNVYWLEARQNRKLRSNERQRTMSNGLVQERPAPHRVDMHYLVTAWSPASDAGDRFAAEARLLYETLGVLLENEPLNPSQIYPTGAPELENIDENIRQADLPTEVAPVEGYPKLAEFWGTMGTDHRWKPAIYLIITLPVIRSTQEAGYMVTTRLTEYRQVGQPESRRVWIQIGGHVLDAIQPDPETGEPRPVAGAWVRLETTGGEPLQTTATNTLGRFTFNGLQPGAYQLNWRAEGQPVPAAPRFIEVPSPTGEYDLRFE